MDDLAVPRTRSKFFSERLSACRKTSADLIEEAEKLHAEGDAAALISNRIQQCVELDTEHTILLEEKEANFRKRKISREEYDNQRHELIKRRREYNEEELRLRENKKLLKEELDESELPKPGGRKPRVEDLAKLILTENFAEKTEKKRGLSLKIDGKTISWRKHICDRYTGMRQVQDTDPEAGSKPVDSYWCPVLQNWFDPRDIVAAHIVPRAKRNQYIQLLFGVGNAEDFVMSAKNGLLLHKAIEEKFDMGFFVIVPASDYEEDERPEYKIRVINYDLLTSKGGKRTMAAQWRTDGTTHTAVYWDDLDGRKLEFPSECKLRPSRRCFFHHMVTAVMHAKSKDFRGWEETMEALTEKKFWASPGEYLNNSLLGSLWNIAVGTGVPEGILQHTFTDEHTGDIRGATLQWRSASEGRQERIEGQVEEETEEMDEDADMQ